MGKMRNQAMDVHGAGAQRSDPKSGAGNISRGPQGDYIRVSNYVRLVRGGTAIKRKNTPVADKSSYPYKIRIADNAAAGSQSISEPFQEETPGDNRQDRQPNGQQPSNMGGNNFIERLDTDKDGKVSASEFDGPARHFKQLDKNNDGFLSEDEAPSGPPPRRVKPQS
jgi:hypothetical protein